MTLTQVPGVEVGHWSDPVAETGCTVIRLPSPNRITGEVRGGAPGTRETDLLAPGRLVEEAQAVVFSGGSAYGLAAAQGVMEELERQGIGYPTPAGLVPIVPAAVIYDLGVGIASVRPGPAEGKQALLNASTKPVARGCVGAGTGATVSKWRGPGKPGGLGSAAVTRSGVAVGALVVVNALGDIYSLEGSALTADAQSPLNEDAETLRPLENTTLMLVATNLPLSRSQLHWLVVRAHDALAVCIRPGHTRYDGDIALAVSVGKPDVLDEKGQSDESNRETAVGKITVDEVAEMSFRAVGEAIVSAVQPNERVG